MQARPQAVQALLVSLRKNGEAGCAQVPGPRGRPAREARPHARSFPLAACRALAQAGEDILYASGKLPVRFDIGAAVGLDLDQAGAGGEGSGQLVKRSEPAVGEVEEGGGFGGVDAAGGPEQ